MQKEGLIDQLVFGLYLDPDIEGPSHLDDSTISFGTWNLSRYTNYTSLIYVPADLSSGTWTVPVTDPVLNTTLITTNSTTGLLTTTQTRFTFPISVYDAVFSAICNSSLTTCLAKDHEIVWNCKEIKQRLFANLSFFVGDLEVTLTAEEYTHKFKDDYCKVYFMPGENWVLGTAFLEKYYVVFDLEQHQVGFAGETQGVQWWLVAVLVLAVLALIGLCVGCCFYQSRKATAQHEVGQPLIGS